MSDHRTEAVHNGDERATLTSLLQRQRDTLEFKCAGLDRAQLRQRAVAPSELSLLGLVRHLAEVERSWFRVVLRGEECPGYWPRTESGEVTEFDADTADPEEAFAAWRDACARSREIVDAADSLDVTGKYDGEVYSLRYILAHMIEEYARHNGHADLLRERIDGATGE